jgi:hypothetical protein
MWCGSFSTTGPTVTVLTTLPYVGEPFVASMTARKSGPTELLRASFGSSATTGLVFARLAVLLSAAFQSPAQATIHSWRIFPSLVTIFFASASVLVPFRTESTSARLAFSTAGLSWTRWLVAVNVSPFLVKLDTDVTTLSVASADEVSKPTKPATRSVGTTATAASRRLGRGSLRLRPGRARVGVDIVLQGGEEGRPQTARKSAHTRAGEAGRGGEGRFGRSASEDRPPGLGQPWRQRSLCCRIRST